jgi:hypothetical protein
LRARRLPRSGRRTGFYAALAQSLGLEYSPNVRTRLEPNVILGAQRRIRRRRSRRRAPAEPLRASRSRCAIGCSTVETTGSAWTLGAGPQWSRTDEIAGKPADQYGSEVALLVDKELVSESRDRSVQPAV